MGRFRKTTIVRFALAALTLVAVMTIATIWLIPFIAQDACLDGGGRWAGGRCIR